VSSETDLHPHRRRSGYITTTTEVFLLNYAVGLDVARVETQINAQGVWPCKLPLDTLPLQQLAKSPDLMSDLRKITRWHMLVGMIDDCFDYL